MFLFRVSVLHFGVWDIFKGTKKMDRLQLQTFGQFSFNIYFQHRTGIGPRSPFVLPPLLTYIDIRVQFFLFLILFI